MNRLSILLLIAAGLPLQAKVGDWRTLRDEQGNGLMVRFEGIQDDRYLLRRLNDGRLFIILP